MDGCADVTHQHVGLVAVINRCKLDRPDDFRRELFLQLSCDNRFM